MQYTSWAFGKHLRDAGLLGSMGAVIQRMLIGRAVTGLDVR